MNLTAARAATCRLLLTALCALGAPGAAAATPSAAAATADGAAGMPSAARPEGRAGQLPQRLALTYMLSRGTLEIARVEESLVVREAGSYLLTSEARAVGLAAVLARGQGWRRESRGSVTADGLRPDLFVDQRGANPVQRARFDWAAGQIRFERLAGDGSASPATPDAAPLPAGTTDRLSFPYALALRATLPDGPWDASITDGRRVSHYRFTVSGRETLDTPAGRFDTLRITRLRDKDDPGTDIWLALDRQMIPVRILFTEADGATFDQVLLKIGLP